MSYTLPGQSDVITPDYCGERIGDRADEIAAAQQAYQAATLAAGPAVNCVFIGNVLSASNSGTGHEHVCARLSHSPFGSDEYRFPARIRQGYRLDADLVRNVGTRNLLAVDVNHVGDAQFLDTDAALAAISATLAENTPECLPGVPMRAGAVSQGCDQLLSGVISPGPTSPISPPMVSILQIRSAAAFPAGYNGQPNACSSPARTSFSARTRCCIRWAARRITHSRLHSRPTWEIRSAARKASICKCRTHSRGTRLRRKILTSLTRQKTRMQRRTSLGPNALDRTHQISYGGTLDLPKSFRVSVMSAFLQPPPA